MTEKQDIVKSIIIGVLTAVLFLLLSYTTLSVLKPDEPPPSYYWVSLVLFPILTSAGFLVVKDLSFKLGEKVKIFKILPQFYKFVLIGVLNTLLDLSILNAFVVATGISIGWHFSLFKGISFVIAVINSYFWNKLWTFSDGAKGGTRTVEFGKFVAVSLAGLGINVGVASFLVNVVGPLGGIKLQLWVSISALAAIGFTTISNFVGYKMFVFKKQ